jgi:uncharacterized OB-fold protein
MSRPVPFPSALSEPFWAACRRHELVVQACQRCGSLLFYPRATCTSCGSTELTWRPVSGRGVLYSFTVARRATHRRLTDRVPYVIAVVELDEGPRLTSTVVACDPDRLLIGQRLRVDFEDVEDQSIPVFRLDTED